MNALRELVAREMLPNDEWRNARADDEAREAVAQALRPVMAEAVRTELARLAAIPPQKG